MKKKKKEDEDEEKVIKSIEEGWIVAVSLLCASLPPPLLLLQSGHDEAASSTQARTFETTCMHRDKRIEDTQTEKSKVNGKDKDFQPRLHVAPAFAITFSPITCFAVNSVVDTKMIRHEAAEQRRIARIHDRIHLDRESTRKKASEKEKESRKRIKIKIRLKAAQQEWSVNKSEEDYEDKRHRISLQCWGCFSLS